MIKMLMVKNNEELLLMIIMVIIAIIILLIITLIEIFSRGINCMKTNMISNLFLAKKFLMSSTVIIIHFHQRSIFFIFGGNIITLL